VRQNSETKNEDNPKLSLSPILAEKLIQQNVVCEKDLVAE